MALDAGVAREAHTRRRPGTARLCACSACSSVRGRTRSRRGRRVPIGCVGHRTWRGQGAIRGSAVSPGCMRHATERRPITCTATRRNETVRFAARRRPALHQGLGRHAAQPVRPGRRGRRRAAAVRRPDRLRPARGGARPGQRTGRGGRVPVSRCSATTTSSPAQRDEVRRILTTAGVQRARRRGVRGPRRRLRRRQGLRRRLRPRRARRRGASRRSSSSSTRRWTRR